MSKMYVETLRVFGSGERVRSSFFGESLVDPIKNTVRCCRNMVDEYVTEHEHEQELGVVLTCPDGHRIKLALGRSRHIGGGDHPLWERI